MVILAFKILGDLQGFHYIDRFDRISQIIQENGNECPREGHNSVIQCPKSVKHYLFNIRQYLERVYIIFHTIFFEKYT